MPATQHTAYSIQTVYNLNMEITNLSDPENSLKIHCKNVIEVPVAESVSMKIGNDTYTVIPATAITIENGESSILMDVKIVIETNEGVTVEPTIVEEPDVAYYEVYLLYLPRGTTGIKKVSIRALDDSGPSILNDLTFDVMEAPYNYENPLSTILHNQMLTQVNALDRKIASLESRVSALENKAGN